MKETTNTYILYHKNACPYCAATRNAIEEMGLVIEMREITDNNKYLHELINGGGKKQVPSLRIITANKNSQWLYESQAIIEYLYKNKQSIKAA